MHQAGNLALSTDGQVLNGPPDSNCNEPAPLPHATEIHVDNQAELQIDLILIIAVIPLNCEMNDIADTKDASASSRCAEFPLRRTLEWLQFRTSFKDQMSEASSELRNETTIRQFR